MTDLEKDDSAQSGRTTIPGERSIASVNAVRTLQSRFTTWLGIGLMGVLAAGLLTWYYSTAFARQGNARESSAKALERRTQGEMLLPPLKPPPLTAAPIAQTSMPTPNPRQASARGASTRGSGGLSSSEKNLERQLKGAVFASLDDRSKAAGPDAAVMAAYTSGAPTAAGTASEDGEWGALLTARPTTAVRAQVLPSQRLLLPKGAFIDCTLETAIDSTLPGMTTCITATDTYGADGAVVLLERGSKLVGETRGSVRQGGSRLFVLWTEVRTPTGVVMPLASPGTDELGRSGMAGEIDRHFWQRFGAAMLVSVVDGAVQAAGGRQGRGNIVISPNASREVVEEILGETIRIPPTLRKPQGDRIQVLVARDLDFRGVYRLRTLDADAVGETL